MTEREQIKREAEANRLWLHTILSSIGDAVIATDREARVTFMNPIAEQLTATPPCENAIDGVMISYGLREVPSNHGFLYAVVSVM